MAGRATLDVREVTTMIHNAEQAAEPPQYGPVSLDDLARRKHVRPVTSPDDLAHDDVFDTDEELDAFLAHVHAARHVDSA
jgi:hypothetical protein